MKNEGFDRLLSAIRDEHVDDKVVAEAGERVWKSLAGAPVAEVSTHTLRTCEDFQALIPGYLMKQLAPARGLLFEDHVRACVACRHAVERARDGAPQRVWKFESRRRGASWAWRWGAVATAVAAAVVIVFAFMNGLLPGQHPVRAAVANVDGSLYAVSGTEMRLIPAGYEIRNGDEVRTAKGSTALVRLLDGSLVEMGERADLSVSRPWKGTTIHLGGGQFIVQAAKQRTSRLYVATDDCLVSVKGTIFSVNHGVKGSRVAVIEGVVRVAYGERTAELHAGDEATSSAAVTMVPIQNEISWSRNAAKYLALLGDFTVLQKQLAAIPGPGLRYSSDLLPYVPDNTVVYAAIPNLANTLSDADRIFQDRLQQSPALHNWWLQQQKGPGPKLSDVLDQLKTFSSYLGEEIVFAAGKTGATYTAPVVLARVRQPGLESFLENGARQLGSNPSQPALQLVHHPFGLTPAAGKPWLVYIDSDLLIASADAGELQRTAMRIQQGRSSSFSQAPLYDQVTHAYEQGAEWLFCADMEQIFAQDVHVARGHSLPPGIGDVRFLTMQHREMSGKPESRATLSFVSERQGLASWLAAPASIGSLEFISPDASMVTAAVIKNPRSIMEEIFQMIASGNATFDQDLSNFEAETSVNVLDDLAAALGGEVTMAFDGPLLPTPRWKLIVEVYDPAILQATITKLVDSFDRQQKSQGHRLVLTKQRVASQTYYIVRNSNNANDEMVYAFVDSYLIAAPDVSTIARAIQTRQAGYTLTRSSTFQSLLPDDGYTNFSAIFYHNTGPMVGPLVEQLKASGTLTQKQRPSIDALTANSSPGLIYAYGEPDQIVVASNTGFMGFDLGMLFTMGHNGPLFPQMLWGGTLRHPAPQTQ